MKKYLLMSLIEEVIDPFEEKLLKSCNVNQHEFLKILKSLKIFEIALIPFIDFKKDEIEELFENFKRIYTLDIKREEVKDLIIYFYGLLHLFIMEHKNVKIEKCKILHKYFKGVIEMKNSEQNDFEYDEFWDLSDDNNITHPEKVISAKEFIENEEVDFELIEEIEDLIENYFLISSKYETITDDYIEEVKYIIEKLETLFELSGEFSNLSKAFDELYNLLNSSINNKYVKLLLDAMMEDLEKWINVIFIEKSAIDIHYLDANFIAMIDQITQIIGGGED